MEENLLKTKEELHSVMSSANSAPIAAPASSSSSSSSDSESDHEHSEENSTYSAELQTQGINDHRQEEDRLTEAEKNERLQRQLRVSSGSRDTTHIKQTSYFWHISCCLQRESILAQKSVHDQPQFK